MILVDTSIWVDHFRSRDAGLTALLGANQVLTHPFVVGEIAMGDLSRRSLILGDLDDLPTVVVATDAEVRSLIERAGLFGLGIGYVDAHLLAAVRLTPGARLWTRDKRFAQTAARLNIAAAAQ